MRFIVLTLLLMTLTLTTSFQSFVSAEEKTTSNLITNGNFETGNSNNWTTSGNVQVLNDCCELNNVSSNYDLYVKRRKAREKKEKALAKKAALIEKKRLEEEIKMTKELEKQDKETAREELKNLIKVK